jgi:hypothetical protein
MDTLPSGVLRNGGFRSTLACFRLSLSCPFRLLHTFLSLRPTRHYPRFRIRRSSFERRRDFNPHEQRAAQHTLRHSPTSPARTRPPFGLRPSRTGLDLATKTYRRSPGSRACCFSACAGSTDYAGPKQLLAINAAVVLPSSSTERSRHPNTSAFRSSIAPPTDTSVYASTATSR